MLIYPASTSPLTVLRGFDTEKVCTLAADCLALSRGLAKVELE